MSIFEITGKDIAELKDDELRDLIGLLCEEECRSLSLGTSGIRYGGHQDAKDGGVDIMVDSNFAPPENSFVPRKVTAFQVKIPKMSKSKILLEMKPACNLRPEIMNLIRQKGAYIMVSSGDSVTESTYNKRVEAMKEAISGEEDSNELYIDFFYLPVIGLSTFLSSMIMPDSVPSLCSRQLTTSCRIRLLNSGSESTA